MSQKKASNLTELDARRLQKQAKKQEQTWQQVDDIYQTIAVGIVDILGNVNEAIKFINLVGTANNNELVVTVNGIKRDVESFTQDLLKIKKRHDGYSGIIKNEDELALSFSVFEDYAMLHDRLKAIIFTPMLTISEFLAEASDKALNGTDASITLKEVDGVLENEPNQ